MAQTIIPAAVTLIVCLINNFFQVRKIKEENKKNSDKELVTLKLGVQALLRDRLYQMYEHYTETEHASISTKNNFENIYNQYHSLGKNGVMDGIYEEFMKLPTKGEEK